MCLVYRVHTTEPALLLRRQAEIWRIGITHESVLSSHGLDAYGTPYAIVQYSPTWTVDVSHEMLEMLVNPGSEGPGMRTIEGESPVAGQGLVKFLVEVSDPVNQSSYDIGGVTVSNFVHRSYYDLAAPAPYDQAGRLWDEPWPTSPSAALTESHFHRCP